MCAENSSAKGDAAKAVSKGRIWPRPLASRRGAKGQSGRLSNLRGGATVRVGRFPGPDRMREMMLAGRVCGAENGEALVPAHCAAGENDALQLTRNADRKISGIARFAACLMIQALPRTGDVSRDGGPFTEGCAAAMSQFTEEAKEGLRAFLEKQLPKLR